MLRAAKRSFSLATDVVDCVVIGAGRSVFVFVSHGMQAGVVGLAIARALANEKRDVLVLEQSETAGTGISSRNSEGNDLERSILKEIV